MRPLYKALFCGDRNWDDVAAIQKEIFRLKRYCKRYRLELVIIEGEAAGADMLSRMEAQKQDVHVCAVDALWNTRYRSAGPQRNTVMLGLEPDEVVAFHSDLAKSKGTKDMVKQAEAAGIPTKVVTG